VDLRGSPLFGVVAEQDAAGVGVDVGAPGKVAADHVEEALRVGLASEVLRSSERPQH
jgi:hypothetical protein